MKTQNTEPVLLSRLDIILLAALSGVLWGLCETVLGSATSLTASPLRAGILTGAGVAILGFFGGLTGRHILYPLIALAASASVQMSAPILHCSLLCKVNSNLAVLLLGCTLSVTAAVFNRGGKNSPAFYSIAGFLSGGLSAALFYYAGPRLVPCTYLASFGAGGGFIGFMSKEGLIWAAFAGIAYPLGMIAGSNSIHALARWKERAPLGWYAASSAATIAGLLLIAATISIQH